jgi:hypothetical protein
MGDDRDKHLYSVVQLLTLKDIKSVIPLLRSGFDDGGAAKLRQDHVGEQVQR